MEGREEEAMRWEEQTEVDEEDDGEGDGGEEGEELEGDDRGREKTTS